MTEYLSKRREDTRRRLAELRARLAEAEGVAKDRACVYVTGSFGRQEAGSHSDLDLFIVGRTIDPLSGHEPRRRALSRLDEICVTAELIEATRAQRIQEFSGDGEYLVHYTVDEGARASNRRREQHVHCAAPPFIGKQASPQRRRLLGGD